MSSTASVCCVTPASPRRRSSGQAPTRGRSRTTSTGSSGPPRMSSRPSARHRGYSGRRGAYALGQAILGGRLGDVVSPAGAKDLRSGELAALTPLFELRGPVAEPAEAQAPRRLLAADHSLARVVAGGAV